MNTTKLKPFDKIILYFNIFTINPKCKISELNKFSIYNYY
jgi:hypothetical protein